MKSRGRSIDKGIALLYKSRTTIAAATLTLLSIQYIRNLINAAVKLETSLRLRHSPPSQAEWLTQAIDVSSTNSSVQSVHHQYQLLDFLQENLNRGQCGWHKCLFPLKTNPRMGYLVGVNCKSNAKQMIDAYTVSKNVIEDKYGMEHIYLAPPKTMPVGLDFRKWMDMEKTASYMGQDPHFPKFTEEPEVVVQAVAIVPEEESIMLGIDDGPREQNGLKGIEEVFTPKSNESWNITEVEITVKHDFAALYSLVEDEKDDNLPCLCADFQIFLLRSGHLVHFDVDRCFENRPDDCCVPKLHELERLILERLQKSHQEQQRMGIIPNSNSSF